ncbi:MAG: acyl-CoA dehydrogenase family protein, partial [Candidatus Nanopelagicales bacterium]|nr:acyl-CoA dehydrogenase family protein [Candidatus Nanopelagicales bacterium]
MDFQLSPRTEELSAQLWDFLNTSVLPAEAEYDAYRAAVGPDDHTLPPVVERLKAEARAKGLWNLFLPAISGLSNVEYATLAEISGWSMDILPEAINCQAPDTGNMETLHLFATDEQKKQWLEPLLDGTIRSAFAMTEPYVASSDATNIQCSIRREGDEYVINGTKWWISGANDPRCKILIFMGKTDPDAPVHRQQSMVLVPTETPGVQIVRSLTVFGRQDQHGHAWIELENVRIPVSNILREEGDGFMIAQARLGPGRIHHCMRAIGAAERALQMMVDRAKTRVAFGGPLADQGTIQRDIAESRVEIEQARLLTLHAAWLIDTKGTKAAQNEIAAIKIVAPRVACNVIDRAIQVHGGLGVCDDLPLARMYGWHRALKLFDGPDEVHLRSI